MAQILSVFFFSPQNQKAKVYLQINLIATSSNTYHVTVQETIHIYIFNRLFK